MPEGDDILSQPEYRANDEQDEHVFWLNGLAGTGKSATSQTIIQTQDHVFEVCRCPPRRLGVSTQGSHVTLRVQVCLYPWVRAFRLKTARMPACPRDPRLVKNRSGAILLDIGCYRKDRLILRVRLGN